MWQAGSLHYGGIVVGGGGVRGGFVNRIGIGIVVGVAGVGDDEECGAVGTADLPPDGSLIGLQLAVANLAGEKEGHGGKA
jgi:hypothetical protein